METVDKSEDLDDPMETPGGDDDEDPPVMEGAGSDQEESRKAPAAVIGGAGGEEGESGGEGVGRSSRRSSRLRMKEESRGLGYDRVRERFGLPPEERERHWSSEDKRSLLAGLRRHGSRHTRRLAEMVPSKPSELVAKKVMRERRKLQHTVETRWLASDGTVTVLDSGEKQSRGKPKLESLDLPDATPQGEIVEVERRRSRHLPIEQWLEVVEGISGREDLPARDSSTALPSVLNWIAECEEHPGPEESDGVDYAAIYRYLALLCQGEAPPDLDAATSARVARLLPSVLGLVRGAQESKETQYLENYRGPFTKYRYEESFLFDSKEVREMEQLSKVPGLNPLGLHSELLVHRSLPSLNSLQELPEPDTTKEEVTEDEEEELVEEDEEEMLPEGEEEDEQ